MTKRALAIDVGGTKVSCCLVDETGKIVSEIKKVPTPKTMDELEAQLKLVANSFCDYDVVGIATAGAVDIDNTKVCSSVGNLPDGYIGFELTSITDKPVFVENDANCAAWAEHKIGAGSCTKNSITVTIGTGVGGGIIIEDKLLRGKSGKAGEIGSMKLLSSKKRVCTCGKYDCFEAYASGTALATTARELALTSEHFKTSFLSDEAPESITTYDIMDGVKVKDKYCIEVFLLWQHHLTLGLISLANIFDPDRIIISGGMGEFIDYAKIQKVINEQIVTSSIELVPATFRNDAGMVGAALLAFEKLSL